MFDNGGTLWCEKPTYPQLGFLVHELRSDVARAPQLVNRPEYRALLKGDEVAIREMGLLRVALALIERFDGEAPEAFDRRVRNFFAAASERRPRRRRDRAVTQGGGPTQGPGQQPERASTEVWPPDQGGARVRRAPPYAVQPDQ